MHEVIWDFLFCIKIVFIVPSLIKQLIIYGILSKIVISSHSLPHVLDVMYMCIMLYSMHVIFVFILYVACYGWMWLWRHQGRRLKSNQLWATCWCLLRHVGSRGSYFWDLLNCLTFEVVASCWQGPSWGSVWTAWCPLWHHIESELHVFSQTLLSEEFINRPKTHFAVQSYHRGHFVCYSI